MLERVAGVSRGVVGRHLGDRGAVLIMVAVGMLALLGFAGLALDSGRGYLHKLRMTRAVDAAALTGARTLRAGSTVAIDQARSAASVNGLSQGVGGASVAMAIGQNEWGEATFTVDASQPVRTTLMRVFGIDQITVAASASAAVPPVDLVLVLDQSGSLGSVGAWDDLQDAARTFVQEFDDTIDQLGLVSFQIRGTERWELSGDFTTGIINKINSMQSNGDTNAGEGLRLAEAQLAGPNARDRSAKVVVFFTDGRPTAFRGNINGRDRMMAVYTTSANGRMRGYFNYPDNLPTDEAATATGCRNSTSCWGWTEPEIREQGRQTGIAWANEIRSDGIYLYAIGLGNPNASNPILVPDMDYLRLLANEDWAASGSQPAARAYFAPSASELDDVFNQVAQDLLVRLAH